MKITRFLSLMILLQIIVGCQPKELPTMIEINDKIVKVKLSHQTTKAELETISQQVVKYGVTMDYSSSTFFDDGKLRILSLLVTTPTHSGKTNSDLMGIQYRYVGFEYDPINNLFGIGEMVK
jgi:hypothetical protein